MSTPLLQSHSLAVGYDPHNPLYSDINVNVEAGEVVALLGRNGAGKSTLLRTLGGELNPLAGRVTLRGEAINAVGRSRRARLLSIVATEATMTGALTVRQLVELGRQPYTGWAGILTSADKEIVHQAMELSGISQKALSQVATLSDGERQKAMIARALAQDTPIMLLDEPLSFLDPAARLEIFSLLRTLADSRDKAIILSCHDIAMSLRMASRVWLMTTDGHVLQCTPEEALPHMQSLFSSPHIEFSHTLGDFIWTK